MQIPEDKRTVFDSLPVNIPPHALLAIEEAWRPLSALRTSEDEADAVIAALHGQGITKIVMMTGSDARPLPDGWE